MLPSKHQIKDFLADLQKDFTYISINIKNRISLAYKNPALFFDKTEENIQSFLKLFPETFKFGVKQATAYMPLEHIIASNYHAMPINKEPNTVLMIVDMQPGYLKEISKGKREKLIANHVKIIQEAQHHGFPIYLLEHTEKKTGGETIPELTKQAIETGYWTFKKNYRSGFSNRSLSEQLEIDNANHIIMTGVCASQCFLSSAIDAVQEGYSVSTTKDLIANPRLLNAGYIKAHMWLRQNENVTLYDTFENTKT